MKKALLSLCLFAGANAFAQTCTIDTVTYTQPGIYPDSATNFMPGYVGQSYDQNITVIVPEDTTVDVFGSPQTVTIDNIDVDNVQGLPNNFTYACDPPSCSFPGNSAGCVTIYSTVDPTMPDTGRYDLIIDVTAYSGFINQSSTIDYYYIDINEPLSIDEMGSKLHNISASPNPAVNYTMISFQAMENQTLNMVVTDLTGKVVMDETVNAQHGTNNVRLNVSELPAGIYIYSFVSGSSKISRKLVVK